MGTFKANTQDFFKKISVSIFERSQSSVDLVQFGQKIQKIHQ